MPLLLAYLKSVSPGHTHHLARACYALENFVENLGSDGSWGYEVGDKALALAEVGQDMPLLELLPVVGEGCSRATRSVSLEPVRLPEGETWFGCERGALSHRAKSAALPSGAYGMYAAAFEESQQPPGQGAGCERPGGHW